MAKDQKVYMPLMIGDWLKGTRGMKAEVRGVYINLLLFQWDNGYIPSDMEELCLIDPELPKVWDKLKDKFSEAAPGKLKNLKNDEVKAFWAKQRKNGKKGGKPKDSNPQTNPNHNPQTNPNHNLHNDIDLDNDILKNKKEYENFEPEFSDYERWTDDVINANDPVFTPMLRNSQLHPNGSLPDLARSHLALLAKYPKMKPTDQHRFRISLIDHITKELKNGNTRRTSNAGTFAKSFSGKYEEHL